MPRAVREDASELLYRVRTLKREVDLFGIYFMQDQERAVHLEGMGGIIQASGTPQVV